MTLDIQAAIEALRSGEEALRRRVVEDLGRSAAPEAISPLLLAVADESWPRCARRRPTVSPVFPRSALLPALEAALRDGENARACATRRWRSTCGSVPPLPIPCSPSCATETRRSAISRR